MLQTISRSQYFANLPNPRVNHTKEHDLLSIITMAICVFTGGAQSGMNVEAFSHDQQS